MDGVHTVEDDLKEALGKSCVVAGRTDKVPFYIIESIYVTLL